MTEQEPKSDCHNADVTWGVDTVNTYTNVSGAGGLAEQRTWICSKCHKPCKVKEERE